MHTKKRILLIHNYYGKESPSGENNVFEAEHQLLLSHGHEIETFVKESDTIRSQKYLGPVIGALTTPWSRVSRNELKLRIERFKPDIIHAHNTFPLISPSIFHIKDLFPATVLTLHNYRLFCSAAIPMRKGKVCTECIDKLSSLPSLKYGCYRKSRLATAPIAFGIALHRYIRTWQNKVDAFIALSDFQRLLMAKSGLPLRKVHVKPNFYPGKPSVVPWSERGNYAVFVGRLTAEKGVNTLIKAWSLWGNDAPELRIVGNGELRSHLETAANGLPIKFLGQLSSEQAKKQIAYAKLVILPSEWFETFGLVISEAYAQGTPVAVSDIGPLPDIVKNDQSGVVFLPANKESLVNVVKKAWINRGKLEELGKGARREFDNKYTEDINYNNLIKIYDYAIKSRSSPNKVK